MTTEIEWWEYDDAEEMAAAVAGDGSSSSKARSMRAARR
jgi:hypothetical protein